jgi:hypothetical protein
MRRSRDRPGRDDATDEEHLRQVSQVELVAQTPEHHEGDDIGGILGSVQQAGAAFVELFAAGVASAVTLRGAIRPLRMPDEPHRPRSLLEATLPQPNRVAALARPLTELRQAAVAGTGVCHHAIVI